MALPAQRFSFLEDQSNTSIQDFQKVSDSSILNTPLNQTSSLSSLGSKLASGFVKNNSMPDISKIISMLLPKASGSSSGIYPTSYGNIAGGVNQLSITSILGIITKSPAIAKAINSVTKTSGPGALNSLLSSLTKQISNGTVLGKVTGSYSNGPYYNVNNSTYGNSGYNFTGSLTGISGIGTNISDITSIFNKSGVLSNGMPAIVSRNTSNSYGNSSLASNSVFTSGQINNLITTLIPHNPALTTALKVLTPTLLTSVLGSISGNTNSTVNINGSNSNIVASPDTTSFIAAMNKLPGVAYSPLVTNQNLTSSLVTNLVTNGNQMGLPPLYSTLAPAFPDTTGFNMAGSSLASSAAKAGDINSIIDIASSPNIKAISALTPNLTTDILANATLPVNTKQSQIPSLMGSMTTSLNSIDPNWCTASDGSGNISLSKVNSFSPDFKIMNDSLALSTDYNIPSFSTGGTGSLVQPLSTNQLLMLGTATGVKDVNYTIDTHFGALPLNNNTQISGMTIADPSNNGLTLVDTASGLGVSS